MNPTVIAGSLIGITLLAFGAFRFTADVPNPMTHDGMVVSSTNRMLVMTDEDGSQSSHAINAETRVTRDGFVCEGADLISGTRIRVTTRDARGGAATAIEAFVKYAASGA